MEFDLFTSLHLMDAHFVPVLGGMLFNLSLGRGVWNDFSSHE